MIAKVRHQEVIDTMIHIAERMRACPDCADKSEQLLKLIEELSACVVDRTSVHDAIEAQTFEDISNAKVEFTTDTVLARLRQAG